MNKFVHRKVEVLFLVFTVLSRSNCFQFTKNADFADFRFQPEELDLDYDRNIFNSSNDDLSQYHSVVKRQSSFSSFPNKEFEACKTTAGQDGHCKYLTYCRIPELQNANIWQVVDNLCVIENKQIGICCPDNYRNQGPSFTPGMIGGQSEGSATRILNRPEERGCGITTKQFPRVTGGRPAEADEWPWMAAILRKGFPFAHCGGVLITDRHVLTAAHCIYKSSMEDMFVRLGEYDFKSFNETRSRDFRISAMTQHIDFDPSTYQNDIAIVRVERPTIFNTYIWPVCMPPIGENWDNWNAIVTGWGTQFFGGPHANVLMEVAIPVWQHSKCQAVFVENIEDDVLCAGAAEGGRDSCQGDSGGPLLVQLPNNRWVVIGIVSWGLRCGEQNRPGLYTRVDRYIPWIIENSVL